MTSQSNPTATLLVLAGAVLISAGILCNEWLLATLFSADGILHMHHRMIIWLVDLFLISSGALLILKRNSLSKAKLFVLSGLLFIVAGFLLNEKFVATLLTMEMTLIDKYVVRFINLYLIGTGATLIFFRRTLQFKSMMLLVISSLCCFAALITFDFYQPHAHISSIREVALGSSNRLHILDDKLGWRLKPNAVEKQTSENNFAVTHEIDENGFKKIENGPNPDFSIYFFGDSFTFGHGVANKDTFANIIKNKYLTERVSVYNAGVMAYGIVQMYQSFLLLEDRLEPGDIVVFTPVAADIHRNIKSFWFPYFMFFSNLLDLRSYPDFNDGQLTHYQLRDTLYNRLKFYALAAPITKNFWKALFHKFVPEARDEALREEAIAMLEIIKQKTVAKGAKYALFFLPLSFESLAGEYSEKTAGLNFFNILDFFPHEKSELDLLHFKTDAHWNVKGHEIAAKAIISTLVSNHFITLDYVNGDWQD